MMRNLRYVMRLWLKKTWCQQVLQTRDLSVADAVNALRPFYFAVHPDFFGQHPREREINENSLKRLNGYLESLQKPNIWNPKPTQLTFYVRQTDESGFGRHLGSSGFRTVSFTLRTRDLQDTILNILNSCSLPTEHVQNFKAGVDSPQLQGTQSIFYRPIKWDKTYYSFTGFRDPEEELEEARKVEPTLNTWLEQNEATATKKLKDSLPLREELELLKSKLCDQLHLNDIRWQRSWGISHRCSQLHSLSRLSQQSPEILKNVKGRIIIFTDQSGLSASGHVMLGTTDVHHQWAKVFEKLPSYYGLQRQMLSLEDRTSHLLGGMQIVFIEELQPLFSIEEYYSILSTFYNRICNNRLSFHPRSLRGLEMVLEKDRYAPSLHELGHFIIPFKCDPITFQTFVLTKTQEARENLKKKEELKARENELTAACTSTLSLKKLYKEPSVSSTQMIHCCERLLDKPFPYLQGMHLCVSHFYSVLQDGDLCIPWKWKN